MTSQLSAAPSTKLSKEEVVEINKVGGAEVLFIHLREAKKRRAGWALASIWTFSRNIGMFDDERSRLVEQINELRYDKHSLLEDNTALVSYTQLTLPTTLSVIHDF